MVKDINPGPASSAPSSLVNVGGTLYFSALQPGLGRELWMSTGTAAATMLVKDIRPAAVGSAPANLVNVDGTLFFSADDGVHGVEPWLLLAHCGDGLPNPGEECDDGNAVDGDGCDSNCTPTGCGNGIVAGSEQCDDGNTAAGDCCASDCSFESAGSACASDDTACTADECDGAGVCTHPVAAAGVLCRSATSPCDRIERCDGINPFCPADSGGLPNAPATGCKSAEKSLLLIKLNSDEPTKHKFTWKWIRGQSTTFAELQDPTSTTSYGFCIYDAGAQLIAAATVGASPTKWQAGNNGFKFTDPAGTDDGVRRLLVKASDHGTAKALLKGKGNALLVPPIASQDLPITAQLVNSDTGACFEASYNGADILKNNATQLKAKK
jgi:ELWxxDGT repeat protein/cysteine-rich repeat protein